MFVYGDHGTQLLSRLKNTHGCRHLGVCDGGERLAYVTRDGWLEYRGVSTGVKYPIKGAQHPRAPYGEKVPEYKYDRLYGNFVSDRFAVTRLYDWKQSTLQQPQGPERARPTVLDLYRFGRRRRRNELVRFGTPVTLSVDNLTAGCWTENFFAGAWGNLIGTHDGRDRYPADGERPNAAWFRQFQIGSDVRCMVSAQSGDNVWGGTEDGRIFRLNLESEALDGPDYFRIPDAPTIECMAVSPCNRYLAVGVDYDSYGAVLVYSGREMTPVIMVDCSNWAPGCLAWRYDRFQEAPDATFPDEALTLFSGHGNGSVCKWYIARQLRWQGLLEERVQRPQAAAAGTRVPDLVEDTHDRVIDV